MMYRNDNQDIFHPYRSSSGAYGTLDFSANTAVEKCWFRTDSRGYLVDYLGLKITDCKLTLDK